MKAFRAMLGAGVLMLARNRVLIISSLGLALISILVFGYLFGGTGSPKLALGVVDQDGSPTAAHVVAQLEQTASLAITTGSEDHEVSALRNGQRDTVIVIEPGFGAALAAASTAPGAPPGTARIAVYYDQSNPVTQVTARMTIQNIVASLNQSITHQPAPVALDERAVSVHNLRQIDWLTPGQLGLLLLWSNLSVGIVLVGWRKQGIMRRLAATPLRPSVLVATQIVARLVISAAQAAVLLGVAILLFHVQIVGNWALLGLAVGLGALTMLALGFVIGGFARSQDAAQAIVFLVSFPMMFLGGSYFSTNSAPNFMAPLVKAMPLTYLNDALRQIINNGATLPAIQTDLLVLAAWLVAALLLSARAFRWS
ncbi:MAG TPA: ABC transporter permease [Ktedonobacterales bacterium]|jgi:ABC-2 type transport system permease protein